MISGVIETSSLAASQDAHLRVTQDAEAGFVLRLELALAVGEDVAAEAQEGEIVGRQPLQELRGLGDFIDRQRRRAVLEVGSDLGDARQPSVASPATHTRTSASTLASAATISAQRASILDALDVDVNEAFSRAPPLPACFRCGTRTGRRSDRARR